MRQAARPNLTILASLLIACLCTTAAPARAEVRLPGIIDSHMVLQRDLPLPIWGQADPGERVTVSLGEHSATTTADANGEWLVKLPAMKAGGPHELTISAANTIHLTDILVGEVWVCSGQSNMEMGLGVVKDGKEESAAAEYPNIRLIELERATGGQPKRDINGKWKACDPQTVLEGWWGGFSAVAYFFGRELHRELGVPVGLIDTNWGGTRIEPWTPKVGFAAVPELETIVNEIEQANADYRRQLPARLATIEEWIAETRHALAEGEDLLPLAPEWPQHPLDNNSSPTGLYNGMIHPLVPFAIRGAIWYQGEANVHSNDGMAYYDKMKALIRGWRAVWGQGDFPFYYVQLAPFNYTRHRLEFTPLQLPGIWEAQTASLSIPNTGMVVTTDISTVNDIHPPNKLDVGKRLALCALAKTYGREGLVYSGPIYRSMSVEDDRIRVKFDHVGSGLATRDGQPLNWFEIAGADQKFAKAQATVDGDTVVVWSDEVPTPAAVRFGWDHQAEPNLVNREGLPASPFRTDSW